MTLSFILLLTVPFLNPHLNDLVEFIRHGHTNQGDSYWNQYITSLVQERLFSANTQQLAGLHDIYEHELDFADGFMTEAEFCHKIGVDFSEEYMPMESNWFLNKAESLGLVDASTYFARARNYEREWNDYLHYNEDLSDPLMDSYENRWRENIINYIKLQTESMAIYEARLRLTSIYWPFRTPIFIDSFASVTIMNLLDFIDKYPNNLVIDQAYERLVWWYYTTKQYSELGETCRSFLAEYPDSKIKEYIKFQLGNAYYFSQKMEKAKQVYLTIDKAMLPNAVYPGWRGDYIVKELEQKLYALTDIH
jgi:hypothetical protein